VKTNDYEKRTRLQTTSDPAVASSDGLGDVVTINGFGEAVKVAAVYDQLHPIRCPVCGHLGIRWNGWFTCDATGDHIVWLLTGDVYVRAKSPNTETTDSRENL